MCCLYPYHPIVECVLEKKMFSEQDQGSLAKEQCTYALFRKFPDEVEGTLVTVYTVNS